MARQQHVPTEKSRAEVKAFAMVGTPQDEIAKYIGVDRKTLTKHYRHELDTAMTMANAKVAQSLFQQATSGNTSAAIFWLKCRAGWVDKQAIEHTGPNGGPIQQEIKEVPIFTPEELAAMTPQELSRLVITGKK